MVFQPFFLQADLPYSAIRGEEFPVKIALYNYLDESQQIQVTVEEDAWFELVDDDTVTVTVAGGDVGSAEFRIRPTTIGTQLLKVTARSSEAADAVIKSMIVEPEGVGRETVENVVVPAGQSRTLSLLLPDLLQVVPDSERAYVAVTGSLLAQTIDGLDQLLQMPFGCGEQNMILFAPDAFILKYLQGTRQLKPEIQAKAEMLLITGYQRELTYRHNDGSFSAFGEAGRVGQPVAHGLRAEDLRAGQGTHLHRRDRALRGRGVDHRPPEGRRLVRVGGLRAPRGHDGRRAGQGRHDGLRGHRADRGRLRRRGPKAIGYLEAGQVDMSDDAYALALTTYALELAESGAPQRRRPRC